MLPSGGAGPSVKGPTLTSSQPDDLSPKIAVSVVERKVSDLALEPWF